MKWLVFIFLETDRSIWRQFYPEIDTDRPMNTLTSNAMSNPISISTTVAKTTLPLPSSKEIVVIASAKFLISARSSTFPIRMLMTSRASDSISNGTGSFLQVSATHLNPYSIAFAFLAHHKGRMEFSF